MARLDYQIPGRENGITEQPWYWGQLDKEQAYSILMEGDNGDFLVRDSARDGEYTLVVRKEDKVRNIRIHRWPSGYGLVEDCCDFANVADLIHYLQNNPDVLHRSFPMIDLLHAVAKPESSQAETTYDLLNQLVSRNKDLILQEHAYRNHVLQRKEILKRLQQCKTRTTALNTVLSLFEEQLALLAAESSASFMRPASGPRNPDNEK